MTDRKVLEDYRWMLIEAKACREQADAVTLLGAPSGVAGQALDGMPRGTNDAIAASIQKAEKYAKRLERERVRLMAICDRFEDIIEAMKDPRARAVCREYYGVGKTDQQIADQIGYQVSYVCRIRNAAMDTLE